MENEIELRTNHSLYQYTYYYDQITAAELSYREYLQRNPPQNIYDILEINTDRQIAANELLARMVKSSIYDAASATIKAHHLNAVEIISTLKKNNQENTERLDMLSRQIGTMQANMCLGFARLGSIVQASSKEICVRLDAINDKLGNPHLTQARELYRMAFSDYNKGFYGEALANLQEAVQQNKTDYFSFFLIGNTFLFGANKNYDVLNLDAAIEAFEKAGRFIEPDAKTHKEAKALAAEICFYLGLAQQTKAMDAKRLKADYTIYLEKARDAYRRSCYYSSDNIEALYKRSQCNALLGNTKEAIQDLEKCINNEILYSKKAVHDNDFRGIKRALNNYFSKKKAQFFPEVKKCFDHIQELKTNFKGNITPELIQLMNIYLPESLTEDTPLFDILELNDSIFKIEDLLEIEQAIELERLEKERQAELERQERERIEQLEQKEREEQERLEVFAVPQLLKKIKQSTTKDYTGQTAEIINIAVALIKNGTYEDYQHAKNILEETYTWKTHNGTKFKSTLEDFDDNINYEIRKEQAEQEKRDNYEREQKEQKIKENRPKQIGKTIMFIMVVVIIILFSNGAWGFGIIGIIAFILFWLFGWIGYFGGYGDD